MSAENVAIVKGVYAAFGRGDIADALSRMHPDIVWHEAENFPLADRSPYVGPEAVLDGVFARCAADWAGFAVHMDDLIDGGDRVVALGRYTGVSNASGQPMNPQAAHVWTLRDGKAVAFRQYIDTLHVAETTGRATRC